MTFPFSAATKYQQLLCWWWGFFPTCPLPFWRFYLTWVTISVSAYASSRYASMLLYLENTVSLNSSTTSDSFNLSVPNLQKSLSLHGWVPLKHSIWGWAFWSLVFPSCSLVMGFCVNCHWWWAFGYIYGHKNKSLGKGLVVCLFRRITVVDILFFFFFYP